MKFNRSVYVAVASAAVALTSLVAAGSAQARDVSWSVGVGVPGVVVGASNNNYYRPQPVYVQPAPVYYAPPAPVYYAPRPVYVAPPTYYAPPVYQGYYGGGYRDGRGYGHGHRGHGHGHGR